MRSMQCKSRCLPPYPRSLLPPLIVGVAAITLGLFEDTGWYTANYSAASRFAKGHDWGYKQGCPFAQNACLAGAPLTSTGEPPHFCSDTSTHGGQKRCDFHHRAKAFCFAGTQASSPGAGFSYLDTTDDTYVVAQDTVLRDYCPALSAFVGGSCVDAANAPETNFRGETFGADSRCMLGTLLDDAYVNPDTLQSVCMQATCTSATVLSVTVAGVASPQDCTSEGQQLTFPGFTGYLECPDPAVLCRPLDPPYTPTFGTPSASPAPPSVTSSTSLTSTATGSISDTPAASATPSVSESPSTSRSSSSTNTATPTPTPSSSPPVRIDCVVSGTYSEWSGCVGDTVCATAGYRSRSRAILTFPAGLGTPCPAVGLLQSEACTVPAPASSCSSCTNGVLNPPESDVDCGTADCGGCTVGLKCATDDNCDTGLSCSLDGFCIDATAVRDASTYVLGSLKLTGASVNQVDAAAAAAIEAAIAAQVAAHGATVAADAPQVLSVQLSTRRRRALQSTSEVDVQYAVMSDGVTGATAAEVATILDDDGVAVSLRVQQGLAASVPSLTGVQPPVAAPTVMSTATNPLVASGGGGGGGGGPPIVIIAAAVGGVVLLAIVVGVVATRQSQRSKEKQHKALQVLTATSSDHNRARAMRAALANRPMSEPAHLGATDSPSNSATMVNPLQPPRTTTKSVEMQRMVSWKGGRQSGGQHNGGWS